MAKQAKADEAQGSILPPDPYLRPIPELVFEGIPPAEAFNEYLDNWRLSSLIPRDDDPRRAEANTILAICRDVLRDRPADSAAWQMQACALMALGVVDVAIRDLDALLNRHPNHHLARLARANARVQIGDYVGAFAEYSRAFYELRSQPEFAKVWREVTINWAWAIATCPHDKLRNGYSGYLGSDKLVETPKFAIEVAQWICQDEKAHPSVRSRAYISLAAAYANELAFNQALECLDRADGRYSRLVNTLKTEFREGRPYRLPIAHSSIPENLTSSGQTPEDVSVDPDQRNQQQINLAKHALSSLRTDSQAMIEILKAVDFPARTQEVLRHWIDTTWPEAHGTPQPDQVETKGSSPQGAGIANRELKTSFDRVAALMDDLDARVEPYRLSVMLEMQQTVRSLGHLTVSSVEEGRAIAALLNERLGKYAIRIQLEGEVGGYLSYNVAGNEASQGFYIRLRGYPNRSLAEHGFSDLTIIAAPLDRRRAKSEDRKDE
jgi:tetratricopeptide (TPR) repeat protein